VPFRFFLTFFNTYIRRLNDTYGKALPESKVLAQAYYFSKPAYRLKIQAY
jgi:hypothetical protein